VLQPLSADQIIPLVESMSDRERILLYQWLASAKGRDLSAYEAVPPARDEFSEVDEPLSWEAEGWDKFL
jgi:hypothetical protein